MPVRKLHADEVDIDDALVSRLLAAQFPHWADLPLAQAHFAGTDNVIYRLGADMTVRLPRTEGATWQGPKEHDWLPRFAPRLPLAIPTPLALGEPGEGYPWQWAVHRWLEGETATIARIADPRQAARDLAGFVAALDGLIDVPAATAAWEAALRAPAWHGPSVWAHTDLMPLNLLVRQGRLSAVIDFGGLGLGEPACDLIVAWNFLSGESRQVFRAALSVDDATWARGRGLALSIGLIALPYYLHTNPALADISRRQIAETLAEHAPHG